MRITEHLFAQLLILPLLFPVNAPHNGGSQGSNTPSTPTLSQFNLSAEKVAVANITGESAKANQTAATVTKEGNVITISADEEALTAYETEDGTKKWVGILISTGLSDITDISVNGVALTNDDVLEASAIGGGEGDFVIYVDIDDTPKTLVLSADGYEDITLTINFETV